MDVFNITEFLKESFINIWSKKVELHKNINDSDIRIFLIHGSFVIFDKNDYNENEMYFTTYINNKLCCKKIDFNLHMNYLTHIYYYLGNKSINEMVNEPLQIIKNYNKFKNSESIGNMKFILILEKFDNEYFVNYYIHKQEFEKLFNPNYTQNTIVTKRLCLNIIIENKFEHTKELINKQLNYIENNIVRNENVVNSHNFNYSLLKSEYKLYNYQKNDVSWMFDIENDIISNNNIITCKKNCREIYNINNENYAILENYSPTKKFNKYLQKIDESFRIQETNLCNNYNYYGGNIISQVGLGKTLITLYFVLRKCLYNQNRIFYNTFINNFNDTCNYTFKRGANKGMNCSKQIVCGVSNDMYCKEHSKSVFSEKINLLYTRNVENIVLKDFFTNDHLIKTNSTLILCPSQLCDQWINEYYDKFDTNNKFRVLMIATKDQYTNLTIGDILFSDIIIVSYKFITDGFHSKLNYHNASHLRHITNTFKFLDNNTFALNIFQWERIILDEAHEIQNISGNGRLLGFIYNLQSKFKWNITGTPFSNNIESFKYLQTFNTNVPFDIEVTENMIENFSKIFRKNTKESIKNEYNNTLITEINKILTFTKEEENIYKSYIEENGNYNNIPFLIRLCCHPELNVQTKKLVENCKTFEEIQHVILDHNNKKMQELSRKKEELLVNIDKTILKISQEHSDYLLEMYRTELGNYRRSLTINEKEFTNILRIYNYLKNAIESLKKESGDDLVCPICLDDLEQPNITKCGHKFCWECISLVFKNKYCNTFNCPTCKESLNVNEIYKYEKEKKKDKGKGVEVVTELDSLVRKIKSTKIGNIIYFLKTEIKNNDKIILFSQWDELLHKVGNLLEENNIEITYCKGSVYNRTKSIKKFTNENNNCNIILLSSCNSASGINLTIANKIILLEPIYGDKEYRQNIEAQAIGRSHRIGQKRPIEVYRFIIGNTIEEDILNGDTEVKQL